MYKIISFIILLSAFLIINPSNAAIFAIISTDDTTCTDSDNGLNYYEKGRLELESGFNVTDFCKDDSRLAEISCDASPAGWATTNFDCPNKCVDGACLVTNSSEATEDEVCVESDKKICDPNEEGIADNMDIKSVEFSQDIDNLYITFKFYNDQVLMKTPLYLYQAKESYGGADSIIKAEKDKYTVSWSSEKQSGFYDVLKYEGVPQVQGNTYTLSVPFVKLLEGVYTDFYHWTYSMDTKERAPDFGNFKYSYKAKDECRDTDGGTNYYVFGSIYTGGDTTPTTFDTCEGNVLIEKDCSATESYEERRYTCPYGCEDGTCVREKTEEVIEENNEEIMINKGVGLTPGYLYWNSVIAGEKQNKAVRIFRNDKNINFTISITIQDRGPLKWLTLSGDKEFTFESGFESIFKQFYLNVPAGTAPGIYADKIIIRLNYLENDQNYERYFVMPYKVTVIDEEKIKQELVQAVRGVKKITNLALKKRIKNNILLKVEDGGEAYYMHPEKNELHYLGRPDDAFRVMREQGIGITNMNLEKIPIGLTNLSGDDSDNDGLPDMFEDAIGTNKNNADSDGDGFSDKSELENGYSPREKLKALIFDNNFTKNNHGKIFLQVESKGEAWYLNPADGKRYFLGRPNDAFQLMRNLSLGISNNDFDQL